MIVGGYTLHMYCDNLECPHKYDSDWWPKEFIGQLGGRCRTEAKAAGWKMDYEHTLCPDCYKATPQQKPSEGE